MKMIDMHAILEDNSKMGFDFFKKTVPNANCDNPFHVVSSMTNGKK